MSSLEKKIEIDFLFRAIEYTFQVLTHFFKFKSSKRIIHISHKYNNYIMKRIVMVIEWIITWNV